MKKLIHQLVLTVEGPDAIQARSCLQQASTAAMIAAVAAAFTTGGITAANAAWAAGQAVFLGCVGAAFTARIDDQSHWEHWWT